MPDILEGSQEDIDARRAHLLRDLRDTAQILRIALIHREEIPDVLIQHHHAHLTRPAVGTHRNLQPCKQRCHHIVHLILIRFRETDADVRQVLQRILQIIIMLGRDTELLRRDFDTRRVAHHLVLTEQRRKLLPLLLLVDGSQDLRLDHFQHTGQDPLLKHREVAADLRIHHGIIKPVLRDDGTVAALFLLLGILLQLLFLLLCHTYLYMIDHKVTCFYPKFYCYMNLPHVIKSI